jgi:hypothetical protein
MRRDSSHLFSLISIVLLLSTLSYGQGWSGILVSSRAINWSNAGLPAVLPDGETTLNPWTPPARTQCGSTISAGASVATINTALAACGTGHYVLLGPGTFTVNSNIALYAQNGVTLRGSGPQSTTLNVTGNAYVDFGIAWSNGSCSWASGLSAGSTSLTMTGCSGPTLVAGELIFLQQCDSGYSGTPCSGSTADNGGLYICGDNDACQVGSDTGTNQHQQQTVYVTSVTGNGPYTVNFSPSVYMPNWSSGRTPLVTWVTSCSPGNCVTPYGNGLEDLTVYTTGTTANFSVSMNLTYASWVKGVRFIGSGVVTPLYIGNTKNCLAMNNYSFSDIALDGTYPPPYQLTLSSDVLIMNNIMASGVPWEGLGGNEGNILAFNYGRDTFTGYYEDNFFDHHAGTAFELFEGNQTGVWTGDNTWGTHDLDTLFRNYWSGWDQPYQTINPRAVQIDAYSRFENVVGNSIGSSLITNYQSGTNFVYGLDTKGASDPLVAASLMRWGNCDTVTGTCRFQSSEVPTTLTGNAVPFENSVPSNDNLPCSFFLSGYASTTCTPNYNGGTGLSFWKVCTSWTTFPTSCAATQTQPFPIAGPDISGGPYVNGTAYDTPASIAFKNLPIDASYQNSYSITGSSWSGGTETLTVSGLPNITHLLGGFQIAGGACAGGEFFMTSSSSTTVSYALASNPGSCAGSTFKFPDVRQFDERVYENDPNSDPPPAPPTGLSAQVD